MTHITPKQREELSELEPMLQMVEASMGFLPTSMMTMAHWPELTQAFGGLGATVLNSGELDAGLKQMIAFAVSNAAGCRYCQAHTANSAQKNNVSAEKIKAVFEFESSALFSDQEKAALRVAVHAGMVPLELDSFYLTIRMTNAIQPPLKPPKLIHFFLLIPKGTLFNTRLIIKG